MSSVVWDEDGEKKLPLLGTGSGDVGERLQKQTQGTETEFFSDLVVPSGTSLKEFNFIKCYLLKTPLILLSQIAATYRRKLYESKE